MRVLFMAHDRADYSGGPIVNAVRLLPKLKERGHEVKCLIGWHGDIPNGRILERNGITCEYFKYPSKYIEEEVRWILSQARSFRPDIFIPNIFLSGGYAGFWLKRKHVPVIMTHRSDDDRNWALAETFGQKDNKYQVSSLVCVSNYLSAEVSRRFTDPIDTPVIPSGVPVPKILPAKHSASNFNVAYAGRLEQKQKRIWNIINTAIDLCKKNPSVLFTIIGEGSQKESLIKHVSDHNLLNRIIFTGRLVGDNYRDVLVKQHAIVLFSEYEGMPGTLMDAMACGVIPVSTYFHGVNELIVDKVNGLLISDEIGLEDAITHLINFQSDREDMSLQAHKTILSNFSLEKTVDLWDELFHRLNNKALCSDINIPSRIKLGPLHPFFKTEYNSYPSLYSRIKTKVRQLCTKINQ